MSEQGSFPEEFEYTAQHVWVRRDGPECAVGVTAYAQEQLGEVVYVDLPQEEARFEAGEVFGSVESVKSVNELFMPVSGVITAVNAALEDTPSLVNVEPYGRGWMVRVRPDAAGDEGAGSLLAAADYAALLKQ